MRIEISKQENYEIEFPDKVSGRDFKILLRRLNEIAKLMEKSNGIKNSNLETEIKVTKKRKHRKLIRYDRETIIALLKIHYNTRNREEKQKKMNKLVNGISQKQFVKGVTHYKAKFNIKPKEVGLTRFPRRSEGWKIPLLKIKKK